MDEKKAKEKGAILVDVTSIETGRTVRGYMWNSGRGIFFKPQHPVDFLLSKK